MWYLLKELVRSSVEETLNGLLEEEAQQLTNAARYERSAERQGSTGIVMPPWNCLKVHPLAAGYASFRLLLLQ